MIESFFLWLFMTIANPHWEMLTAVLIVVWGFFFVCNVWKAFWAD